MTIQEQYQSIFQQELLTEIQEQGTVRHFEADEIIINIGQQIRFMPLLLLGSIKVSRMDESGKELLLYYVNPQESCAMTFTCCMQQQISEIKATAEEAVELISIPIHLMDEWMIKFPSWKNFVMRTIQERFHELLKTIDHIAFEHLDERLVHYLKEKAKTTGSNVLNLSHEQIANDLASSRVVISRLLKGLENSKRLVLYRNQIKLLSSI